MSRPGTRPAALPEVRLKIRASGRHPWFYRKMVRKPEARLTAGAAVKVRDREGRLVGTGFYNARAELALRMFADGEVRDVEAHFTGALQQAVALRQQALDLPAVTDAYRMVHAEADGFPGLILDKLGEAIVAQVASLGMLQQLEPLGEWLLKQFPGSRLVLLQDKEWAEREGMEKLPRAQPQPVTVREHGIRYEVLAGSGHKTGFFADQRDNRMLVRQLAGGRSVLDLCCNSGGFALNAAAGGATSVLAADLDEAMVAQAEHNARANELQVSVVHADAFDLLRQSAADTHDLIVLDPPKWVKRKEDLDTGLRRYADLNRLGFEKVARGGLVVTCSCSGAVAEDRFLRMLREAAALARRDIRVLALRGAGAAHPFALECPEPRDLKVAVLQIR